MQDKGEAHQRMLKLQSRKVVGDKILTWLITLQVLNIHEKEANISTAERSGGYPLDKCSNLTPLSWTEQRDTVASEGAVWSP